MRKIKTVITIIICMTLMASSVLGCDSQKVPESPTQIRIGVTVYDGYDTYVTSIIQNMSDWCKEKEKDTGIIITLDIADAGGSQLTQNDQVEKFIAKDYDAICVNLVDRTDPTMIIDKARAADVPVVFFNRELVKEDLERWDKLFYVGARPEVSGRLQAKIIIDELSDPKRFGEIDVNGNGVIQYVMLEGEAGHQDSLVRTQKCIDELKAAGFELEKIADETANWSKDQAAARMSALLDKYPIQIEMVIANNDDMALGALQAIQEKNAVIVPYVVGINGTEEALEAVRVRKLNGTVYNDAKGQADAAMTICYTYAMNDNQINLPDMISALSDTGHVLENRKYVYTLYDKVTYDNVQDYIK